MPRPSNIDARSFRRDARERAFGMVVKGRMLLAPVLLTLALVFTVLEPTPWRRVVFVAGMLALASISIVEWIRYRRHGLRAITVPLNVLGTAVGQVGFVLASGGVFSPLIPALVMTSVLAAVVVERTTMLALLALVQIPAVWTMVFVHVSSTPVPTLVPTIFGDAGTLEDGPAPWVAACVYTALLIGASRMGTELRAIFEVLFGEAMEERDRTLALHEEQNRALTTLSGEIAHELKNPLSSVKGLSALLAKDTVSAKSAERLSVLRGEVDRMQGILEEFLNFSRPLVPLSLSEVEMGQLAREVARLHEGTAANLGVTVEVVSDEPIRLRGDRRKVTQVLINLVQNALDVSPRGSVVRLIVEGDGAIGRLRVIDSGSGVSPELADRVFDAGVTTKENGSGLGLALARSLARQHGGELALRTREEGGCEAQLSLPRAPSEAS